MKKLKKIIIKVLDIIRVWFLPLFMLILIIFHLTDWYSDLAPYDARYFNCIWLGFDKCSLLTKEIVFAIFMIVMLCFPFLLFLGLEQKFPPYLYCAVFLLGTIYFKDQFWSVITFILFLPSMIFSLIIDIGFDILKFFFHDINNAIAIWITRIAQVIGHFISLSFFSCVWTGALFETDSSTSTSSNHRSSDSTLNNCLDAIVEVDKVKRQQEQLDTLKRIESHLRH